MQISKALNAIRLVKKLPQERVAQLAGISGNWYNRLELGKSMPTLKTLADIAKALDVPMWQIFWLMDEDPDNLSMDASYFTAEFPLLQQYLDQSRNSARRLPQLPTQLNLFPAEEEEVYG